MYKLKKHNSLRSLCEGTKNHSNLNSFSGMVSLKMNVKHKGKTKLCSLYSYMNGNETILETFLFFN